MGISHAFPAQATDRFVKFWDVNRASCTPMTPAALGARRSPSGCLALDPLSDDLVVTGHHDGALRARDGAGNGRDVPKAPSSTIFHSFRLIFGRAIIARSVLEARMLFLERARAKTLASKRR